MAGRENVRLHIALLTRFGITMDSFLSIVPSRQRVILVEFLFTAVARAAVITRDVGRARRFPSRSGK